MGGFVKAAFCAILDGAFCMIGFVDGIIEIKDTQYVMVNVSGVGYKVFVSTAVLQKLQKGDRSKLYTYTHVREDILELYGFSEFSDLKLFELLIGVSGIGPKTCLGIFSVGSRDTIIQAILSGDVGFFTSVPRLGKKNAQKVIIELKGKLGSTADLDLSEATSDETDVIAALVGFGFTQREAQQAVQLVQGQGASVEEKIKLALKQLSK